MATVYTRAAKGSALTWTEGDANITNLNNDKLESSNAGTTGQVLTKTSTGAEWQTASTGAATLNDLTDVTISSPGADHVLKYDTLTSQWINGTAPTPSIALDGLSDVTTTTPSNGQALVYNGTTYQWENQSISSGGITDVVQDTTPQLGGSLDVNGNSIVSASNGNITITPNGTGSIVLDGQSWPQADGTANQVLKTNGSGQLSWTTPNSGTVTSVSGTGTVNGLTLTGTVTSTGSLTLGGTLSLASPPAIGGTAAAAGTFTTLTVNAANDLRLADSDSSNYVGFKAPTTVSANKVWTLPGSDGTNGQVLSTNGSGTLSWATAGGSSASYIDLNLNYSSLTSIDSKNWRIGITESLDTGNLVSISSNQFSLGAGSYLITNSGAVLVTNTSFVRLYLRNVTDSVNTIEWAAYNMLTSGTRANIAIKTQSFVLTGTKTFEFRHYNDASSSAIADYTDNRICIIKVA